MFGSIALCLVRDSFHNFKPLNKYGTSYWDKENILHSCTDGSEPHKKLWKQQHVHKLVEAFVKFFLTLITQMHKIVMWKSETGNWVKKSKQRRIMSAALSKLLMSDWKITNFDSLFIFLGYLACIFSSKKILEQIIRHRKLNWKTFCLISHDVG